MASVILLFLTGILSDYLSPQYAKSFSCAVLDRGKINFGYDKCNFVTAYLYYLTTILTTFFGVILGFLPGFRENLQAKRFRELIFFVVKALFFSLLLLLVIIGTIIVIGYIGIFLVKHLSNNQ